MILAASLLAAGCSGKSAADPGAAAASAEASESAGAGDKMTEESAEETEGTADDSADISAAEAAGEGSPVDAAGEGSPTDAAPENAGAGELAFPEDQNPGPVDPADDGSYRVWSMNNAVSAAVPVPDGFYIDEEFSDRGNLLFRSNDTDSLNADVLYAVYDPSEGYIDENMDDPLEIDAESVRGDEDLTADGPSEIDVLSVEGSDIHFSVLGIAHQPADGAPQYTTEYMLWKTTAEGAIVTCQVNLFSANPQPVLSAEEAAMIFLLPAN